MKTFEVEADIVDKEVDFVEGDEEEGDMAGMIGDTFSILISLSSWSLQIIDRYLQRYVYNLSSRY